MVVATNESSYGSVVPSDQLIGLVRVNAAAIGLDTAHAAITGKSTYVTGGGIIGDETELLESVVLYGLVQFSVDVPTIWVRFGDWFSGLAVLIAVLAIAIPGVRGKDPTELSSRGT